MPRDGAALIAAERERQVSDEKWSSSHDDEHDSGQLATAAGCYIFSGLAGFAGAHWPWMWSWWKPTPGDRVRELTKAGALIAAEIDRLQREGGDHG